MLFAGRNARLMLAQFVEILANKLGRDLVQLQIEPLAPGQEFPHGVQVRGAGVRVADPAKEKLLGGKNRRLAGAADDVGQDRGAGGKQVSGGRDKVLKGSEESIKGRPFSA